MLLNGQFAGGKFSPDAKSILGHGYLGSFHIWHHECDASNVWLPRCVVGGHFDEVRDLCWNPNGEYLLTVSADQTTRCHAQWRRKNLANEEQMVEAFLYYIE